MANIFRKYSHAHTQMATICLVPVINAEFPDAKTEYEIGEISDNFTGIFGIPAWLLKEKKTDEILTYHFSNYDYYSVITAAFSTREGDAFEFHSEASQKQYLITRCRHDNGKIIITIIAAEKSDTRYEADPVSFLSHEIRTPLNSILCYSQLFEMGCRSYEEQMEYVSHIKKCSSHLLNVADNALALAELKSGAAVLNDEVFGLSGLIEDAAAIVTPIAEKHGNRIELISSSIEGKKYSGDAQKLKQVIINLLGNASKFTYNGKIAVECESVSENSGDEEIAISVTDNGVGIEREKLHKIFNPFFGAGEKTKNENCGAGIGLSLSDLMVRLMGGSGIMVESEPGIGSRFHFSIKLKKTERTEEKKRPVLFQNAEFEQTINILIVEDDEACSRLLCKLLNLNGNIKTAIADNENDALNYIGSGGFDVVLMDLNINGVSGIDVTEKIRSGGNDVPIIAVSGEAANKIIENCYKAGMNDFITKPFSMNELINKITNLLKRHKHVKVFSDVVKKTI